MDFVLFSELGSRVDRPRRIDKSLTDEQGADAPENDQRISVTHCGYSVNPFEKDRQTVR